MPGLRKIHDNDLVTGFDVDESSIPKGRCEACIQAKQHKRPFPGESKDRSDVPGEFTHSDVWGPART
jgi:hypothetical protein